jgi:hypothetical protein
MPGNMAGSNFMRVLSLYLSYFSECFKVIQNWILLKCHEEFIKTAVACTDKL